MAGRSRRRWIAPVNVTLAFQVGEQDFSTPIVEAGTALLRTKYFQGRYRKIKVGDAVVSRRSAAGRKDR